jgi:hypothetical protein
MPYSNCEKPVALRPGRARLATKHLQQRPHGGAADGENNLRGELDQFRCVGATALSIACGPAVIDFNIAAQVPPQVLQPLKKGTRAMLSCGVVRSKANEHPDAPPPLTQLGTRH